MGYVQIKGLIVLGIPSNSFNQEKTNNLEVKKFCEVNFNINFPLSSITEVKGKMLMIYLNGQKKIMVNQLYLNGTFIKILINKEGKIEDTFSSFTKPLSKK